MSVLIDGIRQSSYNEFDLIKKEWRKMFIIGKIKQFVHNTIDCVRWGVMFIGAITLFTALCTMFLKK